MSAKVIDNVLALLERGYPQGIPQQDYFPLLALLTRSLSENEVVQIAQMVLRGNDSGSASAPEIRAAIHVLTEAQPSAEETARVAARLASVGWPLAEPAR
ncbi:MAG: DUF3349 domain-containing protein [Actinomycetota bacterium]|nr:DUF3349 domain-containing protein [Actinomycetota bacterium]